LLQGGLAGGETSGYRGNGNTGALKRSEGLAHARRIHTNSPNSNLALTHAQSGDNVLADGQCGLEAQAIDVGFRVVARQGRQIDALDSTQQPSCLPLFFDRTEFEESQLIAAEAQALGNLAVAAQTALHSGAPHRFPLKDSTRLCSEERLTCEVVRALLRRSWRWFSLQT